MPDRMNVPTQQILRVRQGAPIPTGWSMIEWLGTETNLIHGPPNYAADVVLCERGAESQPGIPATFSLHLDDYETANLRTGLEVLRRLGLDTGDWLGQILNKLPELDRNPNESIENQLKRAKVPS